MRRHPSASTPIDPLGRPLTDLRISVTDRCNFRCGFCMPADRKYSFLPKPEILDFEEITHLARLCVDLGAHKLRLTGGEPLLRTDLEVLIGQLAAIDGVDDLAMTSNGYLLPRRAEALRAAGLDRVTISLHSLDAATFARINGLDLPLSRVLEGIDAAVAVGLGPVKLNTVIMRQINDLEIVDLARFARDRGCVIRFIEYMDVGTVNDWDIEQMVSARQIIDQIDAVWPLRPTDRDHPGDVATRYRYADGGGEIGVIPSVTEPFCGDCSRARLSSDGKLYTCLFAAVGHDLKTALRQGASDDARYS